jgi:hypothetical protein
MRVSSPSIYKKDVEDLSKLDDAACVDAAI